MEDSSEGKETEFTKIRVVARVRPFNRREVEVSAVNVVETSDNMLTIRDPDPEKDKNHQFQFDACYWSVDGFTVIQDGILVPDGPESRYSGQEAIFKDVGLRMVEAAWQGYNTAVIAYGTTGSGKTFTVLGPPSDPGLLHRCCRHLFSKMESNPQNKYKVTLSMLEVYNEQVVDLLSKNATGLRIRENPSGVYVENLTVMTVKSAGQTEEVMMQGLQNRMTAATKMNSASSRSHLIVSIRLTQFMTESDGTRLSRNSLIRFVDLAGSERSSKTGATGSTLREGTMINKSLSSIYTVMSALTSPTEKRKFVPYRDSKLTRLLKDELGGSCVTAFIGSLSPSGDHFPDTLSTLRFASMARSVTNKLKVNDLNVDAAVKKWEIAITEEEAQVSSASSEEEKLEHEQLIEKYRQLIRQLEAPWMELESKEKSAAWWSTTVNLQQQEQQTMPYLQNISEDTLLSGVTKHVLREGHILAGKSTSEKVGIHLCGLGIQEWHAIFVNTGTTLSVAPCSSQATVHISGRRIHSMKEIGHLDHIKLGACELFIVIGFPDGRNTENPKGPKHTYEKCVMELADNHRLTRKLKPQHSTTLRAETAALMMFQEFIDLLPQMAQAQALAANFGKNIHFDAEVHADEKMDQKLYVRVIDYDLNMEWLWLKAKFENRKLAMDELYENFLATGKTPAWNQRNNPFCDSESQDIYLGRWKVSLHNIAYMMPIDDDIVISDFVGRRVAALHVTITPSTSQVEPPDEKLHFQNPQELTGKPLYLQCTLPGFANVLWVAANPQRGVYCKLWPDSVLKEVQTTEVVYGTVSGKFQKRLHFAFEKITQREINFFQTKCLVLELWGTQTACLPTTMMPTFMSVQDSPSSVENSTQSSLQQSEGAKTTGASECVSLVTEHASESVDNTQQDAEDTKVTGAMREPSSVEQSSQNSQQRTEDNKTTDLSGSSTAEPTAQIQNRQQDTEDDETTTAVSGSSTAEPTPQIQNKQQDTEDDKTTTAEYKSAPTEESSQNAQDTEDDKTTTAEYKSASTEESSQNAQDTEDDKTAMAVSEPQVGQTTALSGCVSWLPTESSTVSTDQAPSNNRMATDSRHVSSPAEQSSQSVRQDSHDDKTMTASVHRSSEKAEQNSKGTKSSAMCVCM